MGHLQDRHRTGFSLAACCATNEHRPQLVRQELFVGHLQGRHGTGVVYTSAAMACAAHKSVQARASHQCCPCAAPAGHPTELSGHHLAPPSPHQAAVRVKVTVCGNATRQAPHRYSQMLRQSWHVLRYGIVQDPAQIEGHCWQHRLTSANSAVHTEQDLPFRAVRPAEGRCWLPRLTSALSAEYTEQELHLKAMRIGSTSLLAAQG